MKNNIYTFYKSKGKWRDKINPKWLFEVNSTYGVPPEICLEEISKLTIQERTNLKFRCWLDFVQENEVDLDSVRKNNLEIEEEFIKAWDEYYENL